ncbi:uncharacterized protein LOC132658880 [Ovis aries]|uniref:uncharacterized protein LOC132658880 n=1 Tax=Ovis aries TaxID=9940 RepID=UPI00295291B4|nr:uncharacterized protein LOC132658880 [Ovis aries]
MPHFPLRGGEPPSSGERRVHRHARRETPFLPTLQGASSAFLRTRGPQPPAALARRVSGAAGERRGGGGGRHPARKRRRWLRAPRAQEGGARALQRGQEGGLAPRVPVDPALTGRWGLAPAQRKVRHVPLAPGEGPVTRERVLKSLPPPGQGWDALWPLRAVRRVAGAGRGALGTSRRLWGVESCGLRLQLARLAVPWSGAGLRGSPRGARGPAGAAARGPAIPRAPRRQALHVRRREPHCWHRGRAAPRHCSRGTLEAGDRGEYAQVTKMLGNARLEAMCFDGVTRICRIRGSLRKQVLPGFQQLCHTGPSEYPHSRQSQSFPWSLKPA